MLGCPQVQRESTGNRVHLVDKKLARLFIPEQVHSNDAGQAGNLCNPDGKLSGFLMNGLGSLRGELPGSVGETCSPASQILLLIGVETCLLSFGSQRALKVRELQLGIGPKRNVQIDKLWSIGLEDGSRFQVGRGGEQSPGGLNIVDDFNPDRRAAKSGLDDVGAGKEGSWWRGPLREAVTRYRLE